MSGPFVPLGWSNGTRADAFAVCGFRAWADYESASTMPGRGGATRYQLKHFNVSQTALLFAHMVALLELCRELCGQHGIDGLIASATRGQSACPSGPPECVFSRCGARRLGPLDLPVIVRKFRSICHRAGLRKMPDLYYIPTQAVNAFAVGCTDHAAVAVTDGLLRSLTLEELAGVLAHEVAHIRNRDTWTMAQAQSITTATELVSFLGLALLHGNLVSSAAQTGRAAAAAVLVLTLAPVLSRLLQLALSRTREFDADLDAVELAGDVFGLAQALEKLEHHHAPAKQMPTSTPHDFVAPLFRTHPETVTRVRHLLTAGTA